MLSNEANRDAAQIAAHILNGDIGPAKRLFDTKVSSLKHFEAAALRDEVQRLVAKYHKD